jgi:hypothetical protein
MTDSDRIRWLHTGGTRDPEGYEWGVFRVKWNAQGQPVSVLHTLSDLSDLDADIRREALAAANVLPTENQEAECRQTGAVPRNHRAVQ